MGVDRAIHCLFDNINAIIWRDYVENNPHFEWYYAESRLYLIRDKHAGQIYFIEANSPVDALLTLTDTLEKAWRQKEEYKCDVCVEHHSVWCKDCTEQGGRFNHFKVR